MTFTRRSHIALAALAVTTAVVAAGVLALRDAEGEARAAQGPGSGERVVLLHGLGRSDLAMSLLARSFEQAGMRTYAVDYDSTSKTLDEIVDFVDGEIDRCCAADTKLHFVTHSLGGIVLRAWVAREQPERLGRVVMLSPPNHGSALVDQLGEFSELLGPTGKELGTGPGSVPSQLNELGPVDFELGIIAGSRTLNLLGSWILEGPDDGTVSVESAKLMGMRDFLVVPSSHSFMMFDAEVARQAIYFVRNGQFDAAEQAEPESSG